MDALSNAIQASSLLAVTYSAAIQDQAAQRADLRVGAVMHGEGSVESSVITFRDPHRATYRMVASAYFGLTVLCLSRLLPTPLSRQSDLRLACCWLPSGISMLSNHRILSVSLQNKWDRILDWLPDLGQVATALASMTLLKTNRRTEGITWLALTTLPLITARLPLTLQKISQAAYCLATPVWLINRSGPAVLKSGMFWVNSFTAPVLLINLQPKG